MVELVALVPPRSSVSPGAGNEGQKAIKPRKRAKKVEEGYVGQAGGFDRDMDAPAIRRDHHGDEATISTIRPAQWGLRCEGAAGGPAACRQSSRDRAFVNRPPMVC